MKISEISIIVIALAAVFILMFIFLGRGFDGQEKFECYQWQSQAKNYDNFYLAKWQSEQCQRWNIKINAPVQ